MNARDRTAAVLILVTAAFAAFAIGGTPRWAACVASALCAASAMPYVTSRRTLSRPGPLLWLLLAALAFTLIQVVPLPIGLVGLLSPAKVALVTDNARALGVDTPSFLALSYDPPATLLEVAKLAGYALLAYAALRVSASSAGRRVLMIGLGGLAIAMIAVILLHRAFGARELYGVYAPRFAKPRYLAPFLNGNHLAGFMALLAPVCLGLAIQSLGAARLVWGLFALLAAAVSLLVASRAGTVVLVVGVSVTIGLTALQRKKTTGEKRDVATLVGIGITLACALVVVAALTGRGAWMQLLSTSGDEVTGGEGKLAAWRASGAMVGENWLTGVGRGGFETAFARHHALDGRIYSHIENEYLQAFLDWGVPAAALVAVLFVFLARRAASRWRAGPLEAGALGGLVAIALHNVLDFSLAFAGLAVPAIVAVAVVARGSLTMTKARAKARAVRGAAVLATIAAVALAATPLAASAREDMDDLRAQAGGGAVDIEAAQAAWARHPADHVTAGTLALALYARSDVRAIPVVGRALDLNPRHPDLHWVAARLLVAAGEPRQALVEYRLALSHAVPDDMNRLLGGLLEQFRDPAIAVAGLPENADLSADLIDHITALQETQLAFFYARRVAAQKKEDGPTWQRVSRLADMNGDVALALTAARKAMKFSRDAESALLLGSALLGSGAPVEAMAAFKEALEQGFPPSRAVNEVDLLTGLGRAQLAAGNPPQEAKDTLDKAMNLAGSNGVRRAAIHAALADVEARMGNPNQAKWHRAKATPPTD